MHPRGTTRRGVSLLEVAAAAAIMAMIAAFAATSFRFKSLGNYGAEVDTRDLAAQLRDARRRTVATGENHVLVIRSRRGRIEGYQLHRRDGSRLRVVGEYRPISREVTVRATNSGSPEFSFEGNAVRSQSFDVQGPERRWRVSVTQAGGGVLVQPL